MTVTSHYPDDDELRGRFTALLTDIAAGAAERERNLELPHAQVRALREAGFGALRLPREQGGHGASIRQLLLALIDLGAADSNLPQALRQHYFQVELLLHGAADAEVWLARVAGGDLFGSGTTEPRGSVLGQVSTVLRADGNGGYRLTGRKIYGTGNAFAQWIPVGAVDELGTPVIPVVPVDREGVTLLDDWRGFGQRLTATATTIFDDVAVSADEVRWPATGDGPRRVGSGLHQSILLAALAGVLRAAATDLTNVVRAKTRVYFTGTGSLPRHDAVVQEQIGRAQAAADSAELLIDGLGRTLERAWQGWGDPTRSPAEVDAGFVRAELAVGSAQVVLGELALATTAHLLDILGASSLDIGLNLDRHWRNARALVSHNPYPFRARVLGDHALNGTLPPAFSVGGDVGDRPRD
ncbi:MAG: acyl-CoA dehydrogenase family protein [Gordonia sp. (in: high G+C Gram-positive bacteria)]